MRKVIFEQVGNAVLAILLTIAACQTAASAKYQFNAENFEFEFVFSGTWLMLIVGVILFSLARYFYARKLGSQDGYNEKDAELSAEDEREKTVGLRAATTTYRVLIYFLGIALVLFLFFNVFLTSITLLRVVSILILGGCMVVAFVTYLVAWIVLDNKL